MCCFFLITVGECNHPIHQVTQNESEYQPNNISGDFLKIGPLPTRLVVLLIPRMHDPYKLYRVVKVTNGFPTIKYNTNWYY